MQLYNDPIFNLIINIFFGLVGLLGLYFTLRKKYPKSLTYVETEKINLNSSVLKDIDDLKIIYKNDVIQNDIYLIRGFLLNTGRADIQRSELENNLLSTLSNGKWINCKIISTSDKLVSECRCLDDSLFIEADLIKIDEYIYFEALAETSSKSIDFTHRISNLGKIKNINFEKLEKRILKYTILTFVVGILAFLTVKSVYSDLKSSYLYNVEYRLLNETTFQFRFPIVKGDTTIQFRELGSTIYTLGANSIDSISDFVFENNDVINLIYNHPDTIIKIDTEPFGELKVHLNSDAIEFIKTNILISIFLFLVFVLFILRLCKLFRYMLIKKRVIKTTGTNFMNVK